MIIRAFELGKLEDHCSEIRVSENKQPSIWTEKWMVAALRDFNFVRVAIGLMNGQPAMSFVMICALHVE